MTRIRAVASEFVSSAQPWCISELFAGFDVVTESARGLAPANDWLSDGLTAGPADWRCKRRRSNDPSSEDKSETVEPSRSARPTKGYSARRMRRGHRCSNQIRLEYGYQPKF